MNRLLCTRSKRLVCKFEVAIQCMHCKCTKLQMFEYLFPFTVFCERAHLKWLDCSEIFGGFLVLCDVPWFNVLSFYGYRCHPGFIGIRCEHADLLAVVATNQRQQTLATILMLAILGILLLVLLCTVIKYGIYLGYPIILISCIYFFLDTVIYTSCTVYMKHRISPAAWWGSQAQNSTRWEKTEFDYL